MQSGEGNENAEKTTIGLSKKLFSICTCSTLFLHISLPLFCTTTMLNFQKLHRYMVFGKSVIRVLIYFFFTSIHFHLALWPLASTCHCCYKIFILFSQQKNVSFVSYLSL